MNRPTSGFTSTSDGAGLASPVRAVRGLSGEIPIVAQMTFLSDGRTAFGEGAAHALPTLAMAGADAVGMNCTLGPQETHDVLRALPGSIAAPLSVMPNAGYPTVVHGRNTRRSVLSSAPLRGREGGEEGEEDM